MRLSSFQLHTAALSTALLVWLRADVVKCNIQTNPAKYKGISSGFSILLKEQGPAGLFRGWLPTLMGYSAQGAFKFGLYEYFKK